MLDELVGSRIAVANAELRFELLGPLSAIPHTRGVPPVEIGPFYDAGVAWGKLQGPSFAGGARKAVNSFGGTLPASRELRSLASASLVARKCCLPDVSYSPSRGKLMKGTNVQMIGVRCANELRHLRH